MGNLFRKVDEKFMNEPLSDKHKDLLKALEKHEKTEEEDDELPEYRRKAVIEKTKA